MPPKVNTGMLALIFILLALAVLTLVPYPANKVSDLGYRSMCPFAPWSTLVLMLGAGLAAAIRQYLNEQAKRR